MKSAKQLASIIVVVKNDRGIRLTLDKLRAISTGAAFEVIVVDASEPSRLADIRADHAWVRWDQFPVSNLRTTPAQRNRGLELARGSVIVFLDANCVPADGWLDAIMASINAGEDIVCGPVLDLSESNLVHYAPTLSTGSYVGVCTTISVGFRREVVERIGNFDTTFAYGQDVDFFWRARDAAYKIYFNPLVAIGHDWGKQGEQFRRAFEYGQARAHLYKKHWRTRSGRLAREVHVWAYPLFIIGLPLTWWVPFYPLLVVIPLLKNRTSNPYGLILHHLAYGVGVIAGTLRVWPKSNTADETSPEATLA